MASRTDDRGRRVLSTGHAVSLPLELSCTLGGVVVPARRARLEAVLPDGLSSLGIAPRVGCVALVGIRYHRVGRDTGLEPYDEFAAIVPAVRGSRTDRPLAQLLEGEPGGYVRWLPVTTDASVALGRELWGFPKERAPITVTDGPRGLRVVVGDPDASEETVRLEVSRPRTAIPLRGTELSSFTHHDGELLRARMQLRGELSIGSPIGADLEVAPKLASELGLWRRPLTRVYGSRLRARLFEGESIAARSVDKGHA
ncbi:acetoacetate decarboxylase family protein [Natronococcus sp. JC468]|uniref:acetoacetate decarboxylase family protein n=1 Tax=Natronococcus sp. JC468 TaxID=1961921 RepID=UPI001439C354|nr:acetoacetate decarboxylase family protein [Natronococcus sp. JC468]NKE35810.1 acetoacetate decarboxylase family protein [Natronococcus sp. JC468]